MKLDILKIKISLHKNYFYFVKIFCYKFVLELRNRNNTSRRENFHNYSHRIVYSLLIQK